MSEQAVFCHDNPVYLDAHRTLDSYGAKHAPGDICDRIRSLGDRADAAESERDGLRAKVAELEGELDEACELAESRAKQRTQALSHADALRERAKKAEARVAELQKYDAELQRCKTALEKWPAAMGCNGHLVVAHHLENVLSELAAAKKERDELKAARSAPLPEGHDVEAAKELWFEDSRQGTPKVAAAARFSLALLNERTPPAPQAGPPKGCPLEFYDEQCPPGGRDPDGCDCREAGYLRDTPPSPAAPPAPSEAVSAPDREGWWCQQLNGGGVSYFRVESRGGELRAVFHSSSYPIGTYCYPGDRWYYAGPLSETPPVWGGPAAPEAEGGVGRLRRLHEPMADTYACQRCGRRDGMDAVVPNDVWRQITEGQWANPDPATRRGEVVDGRWNLLCLWCLDELCGQHGIKCSATLHFCGRHITAGSQSDADKEQISRLARDVAEAESRADAGPAAPIEAAPEESGQDAEPKEAAEPAAKEWLSAFMSLFGAYQRLSQKYDALYIEHTIKTGGQVE